MVSIKRRGNCQSAHLEGNVGDANQGRSAPKPLKVDATKRSYGRFIVMVRVD